MKYLSICLFFLTIPKPLKQSTLLKKTSIPLQISTYNKNSPTAQLANRYNRSGNVG